VGCGLNKADEQSVELTTVRITGGSTWDAVVHGCLCRWSATGRCWWRVKTASTDQVSHCSRVRTFRVAGAWWTGAAVQDPCRLPRRRRQRAIAARGPSAQASPSWQFQPCRCRQQPTDDDIVRSADHRHIT